MLLDSKVIGINASTVDIETSKGSIRLDNDAVIVCAGGILPTDFLRSMGIDIVTKRGEI